MPIALSFQDHIYTFFVVCKSTFGIEVYIFINRIRDIYLRWDFGVGFTTILVVL